MKLLETYGPKQSSGSQDDNIWAPDNAKWWNKINYLSLKYGHAYSDNNAIYIRGSNRTSKHFATGRINHNNPFTPEPTRGGLILISRKSFSSAKQQSFWSGERWHSNYVLCGLICAVVVVRERDRVYDLQIAHFPWSRHLYVNVWFSAIYSVKDRVGSTEDHSGLLLHSNSVREKHLSKQKYGGWFLHPSKKWCRPNERVCLLFYTGPFCRGSLYYSWGKQDLLSWTMALNIKHNYSGSLGSGA